jgi:hypothetical protein
MNEEITTGSLARLFDVMANTIPPLTAYARLRPDTVARDPSDYERLQQDVEELLGRWEETAQEEGPGSMQDTPLNRLIAERFEIEQIILASRGQQGNDFAGDETQDA